MRVLTLLLSSLSVVFTVLPFIRSPIWWVRIFDFPRVQIAFFCLVSLVLPFIYFGYKKFSNMILMTLVAGALLYQLSLIIKFTPLYPMNAPAATTKQDAFSVMQVNVEMSNRQTQKLKELILRHQPDIISINEPDEWWANELKVFDRLYPYSIKKPQTNTYGMILLSKFPLKNKEINKLVDKDIPSFFTTVVLASGKEFNLHCLHPEPPRPGSSAYDRNIAILIIGKQIKLTNQPAIIVGDLNDVAWSYTTKRLIEYSEVLDQRKGRGIYNTYNAHIPLLRYPLDHFFYTGHFGLITLKKLEKFGSDHFPMFIRLSFERYK